MTVPDDEFISALADGAASARKAIATIEGSVDELRAEVAAGDTAGYDAIRAGLGGPDDPVLDACFELGTAMSEAGLGTLECLDAPISDEPPAGETEGAPPTLPDLGPGRAVQLVLTADAEAGESTGPFTVVDGSDAMGREAGEWLESTSARTTASRRRSSSAPPAFGTASFA